MRPGMTGKPYRLSPLAEQDLEGIWLYTFERWNAAQADAYLRSIMGAFEELASGNRRGQPVEARKGYLKAFVGSHVVYFRDQDRHLDVIRVLHQKQDATRHL